MFKKMNLSEIDLPSNRNFGLFFTGVFAIVAGYFWHDESTTAVLVLAALATFFLVTTLIKPDLLLPLNKLWMRFGLLLGMIVHPIVLGIIFFLLFTPIAFLMRLFRRDELRLRLENKSSHWIKRELPLQSDSFKYQF